MDFCDITKEKKGKRSEGNNHKNNLEKIKSKYCILIYRRKDYIL